VLLFIHAGEILVRLCFPCPTGCCWQKYKVCRDSNNIVSIEPIGETVRTYDSPEICEPLPTPPAVQNPLTCYDMCDYLSFYSVVNPGGPIIKIPLSIQDFSTDNIKFNVLYLDGFLNVSLKTNCGELFRIDVSDVYGIKWISYEQLSKTEKIILKLTLIFLIEVTMSIKFIAMIIL